MQLSTGRILKLLATVVSCGLAILADRPTAADDYPPYRLISSSSSAGLKSLVARPQLPQLSTADTWHADRKISYRDELDVGYTLVLPGVLGTTPYNMKLVKLLANAPTAVDFYDWTDGVPLFKRRGLKKNEFSRRNIGNISQRIIDYKTSFPGRPVYVFALCAGAGVACEAIAELPEGCEIHTAILLGPALSPAYDLSPALRRTTHGIDSYHSPLDVPVLMALTTVTGTVDGLHMPAAGAIGFGLGLSRAKMLRQHMYNPKMFTQGHFGGHFGWTATKFVDANLLPVYSRNRSSMKARSSLWR